MQAILIHHSGELTLNITAHHATFNKWWNSLKASAMVGTATKYCDVRNHGKLYVITGPRDVIDYIYQTSCVHK